MSNKKTYIIAEAGSNHDGNYEQALKLIDIAVEAGADAVKFQIFKASKLYHKKSGKIEFMGNDLELYDFLKSMEVPLDWIPKLNEYCKGKNIDFLFSIFDLELIKKIKEYDIKAIKIASPELNYVQLFEECAKLNKKIIFSTGISKLSDIELAVETISKYHDDFVILHCITSYPASIDQCNLNIIRTLKSAFDKEVGLSDHTMDYNYVPSLAVALGATVIEKHFTISRDLNGADHKFALEPNELKCMVNNIRKVEEMSEQEKESYIISVPNYRTILGSSVKKVQKEEEILYSCDRRSIITVKAIKKGDIISKDNIEVLRAERNIKPGLEPKFLNVIIGKKVNKDLEDGIGLTWNDVLYE